MPVGGSGGGHGGQKKIRRLKQLHFVSCSRAAAKFWRLRQSNQ